MKNVWQFLIDKYPILLVVPVVILLSPVLIPIGIYVLIYCLMVTSSVKWYEKRTLFFEPLRNRAEWYKKALSICSKSVYMTESLLGRLIAEMNGFLLQNNFRKYKTEKKLLEEIKSGLEITRLGCLDIKLNYDSSVFWSKYLEFQQKRIERLFNIFYWRVAG